MGRGSWWLKESGNVQNLGHVASMYSSPRETYADDSVDSAGGSSLENTRSMSCTEGQMPLKGCHASLKVISALGQETKQNSEIQQSYCMAQLEKGNSSDIL